MSSVRELPPSELEVGFQPTSHWPLGVVSEGCRTWFRVVGGMWNPGSSLSFSARRISVYHEDSSIGVSSPRRQICWMGLSMSMVERKLHFAARVPPVGLYTLWPTLRVSPRTPLCAPVDGRSYRKPNTPPVVFPALGALVIIRGPSYRTSSPFCGQNLYPRQKPSRFRIASSPESLTRTVSERKKPTSVQLGCVVIAHWEGKFPGNSGAWEICTGR